MARECVAVRVRLLNRLVTGCATTAYGRTECARVAEVVGTPTVSLVVSPAARKNRHAARVVVSARANSPLLATVRAGVGLVRPGGGEAALKKARARG